MKTSSFNLLVINLINNYFKRVEHVRPHDSGVVADAHVVGARVVEAEHAGDEREGDERRGRD